MKSSELIFNKDGSLYHLGLKPGEVANTIITVGDPERVHGVTKYFDKVLLERRTREFITHTGYFENKKITVISTGIGTDNIDIVLNELHSLFHLQGVDAPRKQLTFIRLGTSGAIRADQEIDTVIASEGAFGFDNLLHFYQADTGKEAVDALMQSQPQLSILPRPYFAPGDSMLLDHFGGAKGITVTAPGFYAPQGRSVNTPARLDNFLELLAGVSLRGVPITNLEMETSGIYGLAELLGHRALSLSAILANRARGEFSNQPAKTVEEMIQSALEKISELH